MTTKRLKTILSLSLTEKHALGYKIDWVHKEFGKEPPIKHLGSVLFVLVLAWTVAFSASYVIVQHVLFTSDDDDDNEVTTGTHTPASISFENTEKDFQFKATDTFWYAGMDATDFAAFVTLMSWIVVCTTGIGVEIFTWYNLLAEHGWSTKTGSYWKFAQFLFPVLGVTSYGLALHENFLSLLLTVFWLWKFGFPETILNVHSGLYNHDLPTLVRVADFVNGIGNLLHHTSAALSVCFLCAGLPHKPWQPRYLVMSALVAVSQHLIHPLKYTCFIVYLVLVLFLEVIFEWGLINDLENGYRADWMLPWLALVLLGAHWMYLLGGLLHLIQSNQSSSDQQGGQTESRMVVDQNHSVGREHHAKTQIQDMESLSLADT